MQFKSQFIVRACTRAHLFRLGTQSVRLESSAASCAAAAAAAAASAVPIPKLFQRLAQNNTVKRALQENNHSLSTTMQIVFDYDMHRNHARIAEQFTANTDALNDFVAYLVNNTYGDDIYEFVAFCDELRLLDCIATHNMECVVDALLHSGRTAEAIKVALRYTHITPAMHESIGISICSTPWTDVFHHSFHPLIAQWFRRLTAQYMAYFHANASDGDEGMDSEWLFDEANDTVPLLQPKFEAFFVYIIHLLARDGMAPVCKQLLQIIEPVIEKFESTALEYGIMAMYAYLGDILHVQAMFKQQLSISKRSVTLVSMHLLMVAHLNFFIAQCQWNQDVYARKLRQLNVCASCEDKIEITDILHDIVKSFPAYNISPTRITYDLLIHGGSCCDNKAFVLDQIHSLSMLMRPGKTDMVMNDNLNYFTLTSRTFAALIYPYIENDRVEDGQLLLQMMDQFVPLKNCQKRKDWKELEKRFVEESVASIQPYIYSYQQDFAAMFPEQKCVSLLKPLYSMKTFNKSEVYEKPDEQVLQQLKKEYKKKHEYLSGVSKIRGIQKFFSKRKQAKVVYGRKGKTSRKHNIT